MLIVYLLTHVQFYRTVWTWIWRITTAEPETCQSQHEAPHPGDFIRTEILDQLGLTVARVTDILGVRRVTLSDLVHGNASLCPEMALRIEKAFDASMDTLLRMQAWYDAYTMRQRSEAVKVQPYVPS